MADAPRSLVAKRLLRVFDVRPVDPFSGMREPAADYKMHETAPLCVRCGREHVKVYEVECDDGQAYQVGSGCVAKTFGGWEPGKEEITRARKAETKARKVADEAARKAWVEEAIQRVLEVCPIRPPVPPVVFGESPYAGPRERGEMLATMGEVPGDPFAGGVFAYVPRLPAPNDPPDVVRDLQFHREQGLRSVMSAWEVRASQECMARAGVPRSPTGAELEGWTDPALVQLGLPQQVAYAVRAAWGRRR